ncbi:hypothetical protein [Paraburkholderia azotifigens]|uniref:hypothetical protein n=1 Tax=Paraburkholderia azotifigens TaxID=2057004 RepID=UPI0013151128|nr:hypothetical protein [Paraburkholderia azotifigens]
MLRWHLRIRGGIREFVAASAISWRHPRFRGGIRDFVAVLQALPLCGAALTFFAAAKKVSKESGLTPPMLVIACGPSTGPALQSASHFSKRVASALNKRITHSNHP